MCINTRKKTAFGSLNAPAPKCEGHFVKIVEVCLRDIVPSSVLRLCPKHMDGKYIKLYCKVVR